MTISRRAILGLFVLGFLVGESQVLAAAAAKDLNVEIRLIWGTNQAKPEDPELYDLEKRLARKMQSVFKWKNYYGVSHKGIKRHWKTIETTKKIPVQVSEECKLEVANVNGEKVEVKVFGKGKLLVTKTQKVVFGELVVVGGDCEKDDTAWFVVLRPLKVLPPPETRELLDKKE